MATRKGLRVCTKPGCGTLCSGGRCPAHAKAADRARGTATQRGYSGRGHARFRTLVLRRDKTCVISGCTAPATEADHHPLDRNELILKGFNPDDPQHGRGLCKPHHSSETAANQPGGWNA